MQSIVITGASSGIGKETAKYFAEQGWKVAATMRSPEKETELTEIDNVSVYQLDVSDPASIANAAQQIISDFGKVDALLNNAGYGSYGILEATPEEKIRRQFDVNVVGLLLVTQAFLPNMRENGAGVIVNVSSVGGKVAFPLGTLYHGSKWAVEGLSEALSFELASVGIKVKIVEPGGVKTNFGTTSFDLNIEGSPEAYGPLVEKFVAAMQASAGAVPSEASDIAEVIYQAVTDGTDQMRYIAGPDAEQLIGARKQMDDAQFFALIKQQLGL
jgi:NAD(P)-dependent dehydrogenase (short-subunit alcohol dehydrogenase family)